MRLSSIRTCAPKNRDVGIPGTSYTGIEMAAALGALFGDSKAGLEVLKNVKPENEEPAREFAEKSVKIKPQWDVSRTELYAEAVVTTDRGVGRAIIMRTHTNVVLIEANGKTLLSKRLGDAGDGCSDHGIKKYCLRDFYEFAQNIGLDDIRFLQEAFDLNLTLTDCDFDDEGSMGLGRGYRDLFEDNVIIRAKSLTAAAATARMAGKGLAAMSCATSGNVGITASLPLVAVSDYYQKDQERMLRSLALSYMVTIYIKNLIGRLSALCACAVAASAGVAAGTAFMLGGTFKQVGGAIQNLIPSFFGVVCDGARLACAMKLASAAGVAIECAILALNDITLPGDQGVLGKTADESLAFLGKMGREGMNESNRNLCEELMGKCL